VISVRTRNRRASRYVFSVRPRNRRISGSGYFSIPRSDRKLLSGLLSRGLSAVNNLNTRTLLSYVRWLSVVVACIIAEKARARGCQKVSVLSQRWRAIGAMTVLSIFFFFLGRIHFCSPRRLSESSCQASTRRASSAARIDLAERLFVDVCFSQLLSDKL
jgi:hypothetical protein